MDSVTLYMLVICTKAALCYPVDPPADCTKDKGFCFGTPYFTMTKAECEAVIDDRARKDGPLARASSVKCRPARISPPADAVKAMTRLRRGPFSIAWAQGF